MSKLKYLMSEWSNTGSGYLGPVGSILQILWEEIRPDAKICPKCGVEQTRTALKNPGLAAVASFFFAGLGQIYNGEIGKGVLLMVVQVLTYFYVLSVSDLSPIRSHGFTVCGMRIKQQRKLMVKVTENMFSLSDSVWVLKVVRHRHSICPVMHIGHIQTLLLSLFLIFSFFLDCFGQIRWCSNYKYYITLTGNTKNHGKILLGRYFTALCRYGL